MINKLILHNFKGIAEETLLIRPLTVFTGLNSTGKSSCFQAVLSTLYYSSPVAKLLLNNMDFSFAAIRNKNNNAKDWSVEVACHEGHQQLMVTSTSVTCDAQSGLELEKNIYYLSANRMGYVEPEAYSPQYHVGVSGEYVFDSFEKEKSTPIEKGLVRLEESETLSAHFNYWLSYILNIKFEMQTERITAKYVNVEYKSDGLAHLSPSQLGVGVSYLAKILIICLRAKRGDVLMLENPEIHLHPAAQARLGEFFCYVANAGIQVMIETHCEHLINKLQYQVYKGLSNAKDVIIYYKSGITTPFKTIQIKSDGNFQCAFPEGFFDATLDNLLEIE